MGHLRRLLSREVGLLAARRHSRRPRGHRTGRRQTVLPVGTGGRVRERAAGFLAIATENRTRPLQSSAMAAQGVTVLARAAPAPILAGVLVPMNDVFRLRRVGKRFAGFG